MTYDEYESTITIDAKEGYVEATAFFDIRLDHYEITSCRMYRWDFNGRPQKRDTLVALIGHVEVNKMEESVIEEYYEYQD